jgi:hypothetical protein
MAHPVRNWAIEDVNAQFSGKLLIFCNCDWENLWNIKKYIATENILACFAP